MKFSKAVTQTLDWLQYNWFTDGCETRELQEARTLLEEFAEG